MPSCGNQKQSKVETIKESSNYLRGTISKELTKDATYFEEADNRLLKFHGIYQQDNRDTRQERIARKQGKEFYFMVRTKLPAGKLTAKQYLLLNEICDKYSNQTLRITTRQNIQFHGVIKKDLHKTLHEINKSLSTTYGACGDVVRNVIACPVCDLEPNYSVNLDILARDISNYFLPQSSAYYEIWVNEETIEQQGGKIEAEQEPLYGKTYLPRKFKIGLILPQDNCIDVFDQDIGIVAIREKSAPVNLTGFNILIGGSLGHTYNRPKTYPRLASELCFVTTKELINVLEKIVMIQRDYGDREDRKHARLKYLIDDKGLDWLKSELENRLGFKLAPPKPVLFYKIHDHIGWHKQINDKWYLGLFIEAGRICDRDERKLKSGLKEIIEKFDPGVRLSPQQNIILVDIDEKHKEEINKIIKKHNIYTNETISNLRRNSLVCPALPTCGLALAEAERVLPKIINELERLGFGNEVLSIRMSGCSNSCSRTPLAELGIIGASANKYNIYVGGTFEGTRLNKLYKENIISRDLPPEIAILLKTYRNYRSSQKESFGNFAHRVGIERLKDLTN